MYKKDLALNNLQWLICHKTQPYYYNKENKHKMQSFITFKEIADIIPVC